MHNGIPMSDFRSVHAALRQHEDDEFSRWEQREARQQATDSLPENRESGDDTESKTGLS